VEQLKTVNQQLSEQVREQNSKLLELDAKLNDPNYMRSLYQEPKEVEDPEPQFEPIDADNMTAQEVAAEMDRRQRELIAWNRRQTEARFAAKDQEEQARQLQQEREAETARIRDFVSKTEDFDTYKEDVRELYGTQLSIEQAYEYARLKKIERQVKEEGGHPRRQAMRSTRSAENATMEKNFETVADGAKAALDEVLEGFDGEL
jgi:hypothetical protein